MIKNINMKHLKSILIVLVISFSTFFILEGLHDFFYRGSLLNVDNYRNTLTGMVPFDNNREPSSFSPSFQSDEIINNQNVNEHNNLIMSECRLAHQDHRICYNLIKSLISVTSQGNANYLDEYELRFGLVPMFVTDEFDASDLFIPETNIRLAVQNIMRLYDVYNGDLAFVSLAYFAGRALTNEILYNFQRNIHEIQDSVLDVSTIFSELDRLYETSSVLTGISNLKEKNDVKQFYINVLFAYHIWSGSPEIESSSADFLYELGTYSLRPSFSTRIRYNISEIKFIDEIISGFVEDSESRNNDLLYPYLVRYIRSNYEVTYYDMVLDIIEIEQSANVINSDSWNNPNLYIKTNDLVWKRNSCIPEIAVFNLFVERFIDCINSNVELFENGCYCDFSDISFVNDDYSININLDKNDVKLKYQNLIFELVKVSNEEIIKKYIHPIMLDGYYGNKLEIHIANADLGIEFLNRLRNFLWGGDSERMDKFSLSRESFNENWNINPESILIITSNVHDILLKSFSEDENITYIMFTREQTEMGDLEYKCNIQKQYEKLCVQSNNTLIYNNELKKYTPIRYNFAFAINPLELNNSVKKDDVDLDGKSFNFEMEKKTITFSGEDRSNINAEIGPFSFNINPSQICGNRCSDNRLLGKPISYTNKRENIMIVSLEDVNNEQAISRFNSLSSSTRKNDDWIDEKHRAVHYLIDELGNIVKLAREDAVIQFARCFDGNTIYIGLTGGENKYSENQLVSLARLSYEISLRNQIGININNPNFHNHYIENIENLKPDIFPADYNCNLEIMNNVNSNSFREKFYYLITNIDNFEASDNDSVAETTEDSAVNDEPSDSDE